MFKKEKKFIQVDTKNNKMKKRHTFIMLACCMIPIVLIFLVPYFSSSFIGFTPLLILLCPILHIGMMYFMKDHF